MTQPEAEPYVLTPLAGWGRFPVEDCKLFRPERTRDVQATLLHGGQKSYISRGLGRSYGDASLNAGGGVVLHTRLNRFLEFDETSGELRCEAGASLADIIERFLPLGFFLPVTPGTKFVTVGGAIACDVHGKNHHRDGTFGEHVKELTLFTADGELLRCSPEENPDVFWATIGGMGLTGIIVEAGIQLRPVESAYMRTTYRKATDLDTLLDLLSRTEAEYQYSVAWIDCLARGRRLGRSVLMLGDHVGRADVRGDANDPLLAPRTRRKVVPFDLPSLTLNRFSVGLFNELYFGMHREAAVRVTGFDAFFYPLDSILHWNRLYGRRGFTQFQVVLPDETGTRGLEELLELISRSRRASFLAVLKRFGVANPGLLSFPFKGYTLALDLPMTPDLPDFLRGLHDRLLHHGGRVYLAKDAVAKAESIAAMYPRLPEFREIKRRLDPGGLASSSLARRVGIIGV